AHRVRSDVSRSACHEHAHEPEVTPEHRRDGRELGRVAAMSLTGAYRWSGSSRREVVRGDESDRRIPLARLIAPRSPGTRGFGPSHRDRTTNSGAKSRRRPYCSGMTSPRVAMVLGAGGSVGHAFHVGVLSALADELGWD